jgi:uncharacterized protein YbjT (DUF2867 family)
VSRILVLGGTGNFGARICRALAGQDGMEVVAAGRRRGAHVRLDTQDPGFADGLRRVAPDIVIHCAGPFQGQDYRVARAAIASGAHYVDLADGREFVARFPRGLDTHARAANVLAVSGASTLPALSSAVVDALSSRFERMEELQIAIAPGQRAPRGAATLAAVFSYCGRRFQWLSGGDWRDAWGWQELTRLRFAGLGARWAAACDVPDLALLPARYPTLKTVEFRAALELAIFHFGLWLVAGARRLGLPVPLERWAAPLDRLATQLDRFGGDHGGMLIRVTGRGRTGEYLRIDWHLTVDALHGPEIPCFAAILLAEKLARGTIAERGAFSCMGLLALSDFEPAFHRWRIRTSTEEVRS